MFFYRKIKNKIKNVLRYGRILCARNLIKIWQPVWDNSTKTTYTYIQSKYILKKKKTSFWPITNFCYTNVITFKETNTSCSALKYAIALKLCRRTLSMCFWIPELHLKGKTKQLNYISSSQKPNRAKTNLFLSPHVSAYLIRFVFVCHCLSMALHFHL